MTRLLAVLVAGVAALSLATPTASAMTVPEPDTGTATLVIVDDTFLTPPYVEVQAVSGPLRAGGPVKFSAFFFNDGAPVSFFIDASARPIGSAIAAPTARPGSDVLVPAAKLLTVLPLDLSQGGHLLSAMGPNIDGQEVTVKVAFQVQSADAPTELPQTGGAQNSAVLAGMGMVALGSMVLILTRRRRHRSVTGTP